MSETIRTSYRGWDITASCLKHPENDPRAARRFTGRAFAVLGESGERESWSDPRTQTAAIVNQLFDSPGACTQDLLIQIKQLIDGLRAPAPA